MSRINKFYELFNGLYMGRKLQRYDFTCPLISFPWSTLFIYFSLFRIWKVKLEIGYTAVKLLTSSWIWIYVFGKRWMSIHILCSWYFNYVVELYFSYLNLHLCVPQNSLQLAWLNSWQCLLTSCIDWTWNILHLCTQIRYEKVLYFNVRACLNMCKTIC